MIKPKMKINN